MGNDLSGKVACVTGASRGIGKGIALGLAEQGATIYITGRSINSGSITNKNLGGSLDILCEEIKALGGEAIPVKVDHSKDEEVEDLFHLIEKNHGKLDILVNNAFQVPKPPDGSTDEDLLFKNFWEQPGWFWDSLINVGLRSHYIASCWAFPLMQKTALYSFSTGETEQINKNPKPLIVHVSSFGGVSYSFNVAYGVGKAGVDRLARDMNIEMKPHNVECVSLYPGIVRTEMMASFLDSGKWREKSGFGTPMRFVESPLLSGRVVAELYKNRDGFRGQQAGKVCVTAEVAKRYGIVDPRTGEIPPSIRSLKFLIPSVLLGKMSEEQARQLEDFLVKVSPDVLVPMQLMGVPPPE